MLILLCSPTVTSTQLILEKTNHHTSLSRYLTKVTSSSISKNALRIHFPSHMHWMTNPSKMKHIPSQVKLRTIDSLHLSTSKVHQSSLEFKHKNLLFFLFKQIGIRIKNQFLIIKLRLGMLEFYSMSSQDKKLPP